MNEPQSACPAVACPYCGGERFSDGEVPQFFGMEFVRILPEGRKAAGKPLQARLCERCGNVQVYVRV
jgi:hypothetical protein